MSSLRSRLNLPPNAIYLLDGSAFVYRAFYALQSMSRSDGFPTNILFIVTRMLLKIIREEQPSYLLFVLDGKGPSFRNDIYKEYKANRSATPEALIEQLEPLKEIISRLGLAVHVSKGCEADDCIASLVHRFSEQQELVIVGADKDLLQCLNKNVIMWDPASRDERITTLEDFVNENEMQPSSWPDYQALVGDSSDNIPGIPQIGPKTAQPLIKEFKKLEELFERLAAVPPKSRAKLEGKKEDAFLYRDLTSLRTDVCTEVNLSDLKVETASFQPIMSLFEEYELHSLVREVQSMDRMGIWEREAPAYTPPSALDNLALVDEEAKSPPTAAGKAKTPTPKNVKSVETSLFTVAPVDLSPDLDSFDTEEHLNSLKNIEAGEAIFALQVEEKLLLAIKGKQFIYTGSCSELCDLIKDKKVCLLAADLKALLKSYKKLREIPIAHCYDLSLAAYLLSPEDRAYEWKDISLRYGELSGSKNLSAKSPGFLGLDIYQHIQDLIKGAELEKVLRDIEIPLVPVLISMEERGISIDRKAFDEFLREVEADLDKLTSEIYKIAGTEFNVRSSQQLGEILFTKLKLPPSGKTRGGAFSTSQAALEKIHDKHPIIAKIMEFRTLEKLRSTYLEPLPMAADKNGRIHTTFNQTATATGRLSSSDPNLQNIPIRGPMGGRMRSCFVSAPGKKLICADYSQIELRVLAHMSQDPTLLEAFHNNQDIHRSTAALLFDVRSEDVNIEQRRNAKTINFGLIYGMGAQRLGRELGIKMSEAKSFIEKYFESLAKLKEFYDNIEQEAANDGYVATISGRRRLTPDIISSNNMLRSQARRQAINTRIQGSAADIIKIAMLEVEEDQKLKELGATLLLQIHDELVLESSPENAEEAGKRLANIMSNVKAGGEKLTVPLLVDWGIGDNWSQTD